MDIKKPQILRHHVASALEDYFARLDGVIPTNLYYIVIREIEIPLIKAVLKYTNNNQTVAANMLGISRNTLRKKLQYVL